MKTAVTKQPIPRGSIMRILGVTGVILAVPFIAMQFSDDVQWNLFDFVVIGGLLMGVGLVYELLAKRVSRKYRILVMLLIILGVLLIWAELAVGILGTPFAGD